MWALMVDAFLFIAAFVYLLDYEEISPVFQEDHLGDRQSQIFYCSILINTTALSPKQASKLAHSQ